MNSSLVRKKVCSKCKHEKPATPEHFTKNRAKEDGLQAECRPCRKLLVDPQLKKYREDAAKSATALGQVWTPEQIAIACDRSLTIMVAAEKLGRTYNAVATRRRLNKGP